MMKLTQEWISLAMSEDHHDHDLRAYNRVQILAQRKGNDPIFSPIPERLEEVIKKAEREGISVAETYSPRNSVFGKRILLSRFWRDKPLVDRIATVYMCILISRQKMHYGHLRYVLRYSTSKRFRWAMSTQSVIEGIRVIRFLLGNSTAESSIVKMVKMNHHRERLPEDGVLLEKTVDIVGGDVGRILDLEGIGQDLDA